MRSENVTENDIVRTVKALRALGKQMVLVGGSAVSFYAEDAAAGTPRPTEDIDLIIVTK